VVDNTCDLCSGTGQIGFFFDCDDCKLCTCPKCFDGSWEEYNRLNELFQECRELSELWDY